MSTYGPIDDAVNKGGVWKMPFAVADCVLNRRFIDEQWWAMRSYIFYLQLLGIEFITNFVYQINNNHWATGWMLAC